MENSETVVWYLSEPDRFVSSLLNGVLKKAMFRELMFTCLKQDQLEISLRENVLLLACS